ncbi:MAG TPA: hypothetical protein VK826_19280 [Bacteroidia bacterium]|nr:hypothetical protein [Bacteroidia bacterium]
MKIPVIAFCAIIQIFLLSCGQNAKQYTDGDTVFFPDTTAFKQSWKMEEHKMLNELFAADSLYNQLELDTFDLYYSNCDCPDWIDRSKEGLGCKECSDFYVEPADPTLELPWEFHVSGNTVRYHGVLIPGYNLPQGRKFTVPNPPAWTVLRYYGYEVIQPYKIWGPTMRKFQGPGDTLESTVTLTIK